MYVQANGAVHDRLPSSAVTRLSPVSLRKNEKPLTCGVSSVEPDGWVRHRPRMSGRHGNSSAGKRGGTAVETSSSYTRLWTRDERCRGDLPQGDSADPSTRAAHLHRTRYVAASAGGGVRTLTERAGKPEISCDRGAGAGVLERRPDIPGFGGTQPGGRERCQ